MPCSTPVCQLLSMESKRLGRPRRYCFAYYFRKQKKVMTLSLNYLKCQHQNWVIQVRLDTRPVYPNTRPYSSIGISRSLLR